MKQNHIIGKEIIIFCPSFFGYDREIKQEFEGGGANVSLFDERVFNNSFGKALIRLNYRALVNFFINDFYEKTLINKIKSVDYVIFINPETVTQEILLKAKKINPRVKIITYMWDSFKNKPYSKKYIPLSDSFFTFDPIDANENNVKFLPLFFIRDYQKKQQKDITEYDFCFIGTAHSERFNLVNKITANSKNNFLFFYSPNPLVFLYKKYIKNELNGLCFLDVSFDSMERKSIINILEKSNIIIDINHSSQRGLTMRTIEMIGSKKKIITTNSEVINYDFYEPENILVFTEEISIEDIDKFKSIPYKDLPENIYQKYSIESWIKILIGA